jgi:hypothetical protein
LITLAGRTADPLRPHPCKVAYSVGVFMKFKLAVGGMAKVELDRKAAGLSGPLARTSHSH